MGTPTPQRRTRRSGHPTAARLVAASLLLGLLVASCAAMSPAAGDATWDAFCPGYDGTAVVTATGVVVPGAELSKASCIPSLTTGGLDGTAVTGFTNSSDHNGMIAGGTQLPTGVPGLQVDGYFPDDAAQQHNDRNGWNHNAQFVLRFPSRWNGDLVITGAHGVGTQYNSDTVISDWAVANGYAYASTDKGNSGASFNTDGDAPGDALAEWHVRVTELTVAAKLVFERLYGAAPAHTWMTGISNGGYLTRYALENHPELYDGGVDWEGTLLSADLEDHHLFSYLPTALASYVPFAAGDADAHQAMLDAGFAAGSEFLWFDHYTNFWDATQRAFREEFDGEYDGWYTGGVPFCPAGLDIAGCDADYDLASRPDSVQAALQREDIVLTGNIGKPMITLHGDMDAVLPIATDSDIYARMIGEDDERATELHRYYVVEDGTHIDGRYDVYPNDLRPMLPCYWLAFEAMVAWVADGTEPAPSGTIERPASGDLVNSCALPTVAAAG